jgi:hypothetical protein
MLLFILLLAFCQILAEPFLSPQLSLLTLPILLFTKPAFLFGLFILDHLFIFTAFGVEVLQVFRHKTATLLFDSLNPQSIKSWQQNLPIGCQYFFFFLPDRHKYAPFFPRLCLIL